MSKKIPMAAERNNTRKRKKDEIKKDEKPNMTFSKQKLGIFNKAIELSILCESETALIVISPDENKLYECGYPNYDAVIQRFLTGHTDENEKKNQQDDDIVETLRLRYEAMQGKLNEEQEKLEKLKATEAQKSNSDFPYDWWNKSIDDMDLTSLEDITTSLDKLKINLSVASQAKKFNLHPIQENVC
ncbi:MADS-box transcription factor family protein [Medicago truncatula]|uniref:MADS-box transcription factor family protein n=3 Tax=Medicago truncatula TaxID=3880 RepID=A0A072UUA3_MEDTR|nr:MADS-box transcription factor family protein [Medicago truncatula]